MTLLRGAMISLTLGVITIGMLACSQTASTLIPESVPNPTPMGTLTSQPKVTIELTINGPMPPKVVIEQGEPILFRLVDESYGQSTVQFDDRRVGTMLWLLPNESRVFTRLDGMGPGTYTYTMLTQPNNVGTVVVK